MNLTKIVTTIAASAFVVAAAAGCAVTAPTQTPTQTQAQGETEAVLVPGAKTRAQTMARNYLDYAGFSESGLAAQLRFEGFGDSAAAWAAANSGADWNQEAADAAEMYRSSDVTMSRKGMIDQLKFEGFTQAQATYGAKSVGY